MVGFVGKDVAEVLGYKDPSKALCDRVEDEDKTTLLIQQSGSSIRQTRPLTDMLTKMTV